MSSAYTTHRSAALALLGNAELNRKEGGFLGQIICQEEITEKQRAWLCKLLERHGLAFLATEGAA